MPFMLNEFFTVGILEICTLLEVEEFQCSLECSSSCGCLICFVMLHHLLYYVDLFCYVMARVNGHHKLNQNIEIRPYWLLCRFLPKEIQAAVKKNKLLLKFSEWIVDTKYYAIINKNLNKSDHQTTTPHGSF